MRSVLAVLALGLFVTFNALAAAVSPAILIPMPGQTFSAGGAIRVIVAATPAVTKLKVELSYDGGNTFTTVGTIPSTKTTQFFDSTLSSTNTSNTCVVRVTGNRCSPTLSGQFSIVASATSVPPSGVAGGDLTGAYPNPTIAPGAVTASKISSGQASDNLVLTADGSGDAVWLPAQTAAATGASGPAGGDLTGTYPNPSVNTVGGQSAGFIASGAIVANAATTASVPNTLVSRDASGNFRAGIITGTLNGNAASASSFSGVLSGDVTGWQNVTAVSKVGGQSASFIASGAIAANAATTVNASNTLVSRDANGNFSAGTITLGVNPVSNLQAATKEYVDQAAQAVPSGYSILGSSTTPPAGYTYSGCFVNPANAGWSTEAAMPTARYGIGAPVVNNVVYAIGGQTGSTYLSIVEAYNPSTNSWSTVTSMPTARYGVGTAVVNNVIYVIGGCNGTALNNVEAYNLSTNLWSTMTPMPTARHALGVAVVNNIIYAIGGCNNVSTGAVVTTVEAYNLSTNAWTTMKSMPTARQWPGVVVVNNIIYAIGGISSGVLQTVEAYNPTTNSWSTEAVMPTARSATGVAEINNIVYAIGGYNGSYLQTVEAYNPTSNTWSTQTVMPTGRAYLGAAVVNNTIYAIGGQNGYDGPGMQNVEAFNNSTFFVHTKN